MNNITALSRKILEKGGYTCVIVTDGHIYTSQFRGVKPLVHFLQSRIDFSGAEASDRVVGRATAFLYVLLGVRALYAHVLSDGALEVLRLHGIETEYERAVPHIINRRGDGICPFEAAVSGICEPAEALLAIMQKMSELGIS